MLVSAAEVLRERGAAGVTIDEVLHRSGAPRGSVYYHFPAGRSQILAEALRHAGDAIADVIDATAEQGWAALLQAFAEYWEWLLCDSDFTAGCPVVGAVIDVSDDDAHLTPVAGEIFDRWHAALARTFAADGFSAADAAALSVTCIAALEGAVLLCRATRRLQPLRDVATQLELLCRTKQFVGSVSAGLGSAPAGTHEVTVDARIGQRPFGPHR